MSSYKVKTFPFQPRSPVLAAWMQSLAFILAANWCLQGMRGMDRKELAFRLAGEGIAALLLAGGLWALGLAPIPAAVFGLLAAHTLNFTLNGQVWVCARYGRWYRRSPSALERFLRRLAAELRAMPWLEEAVCIGSRGDLGLVRGERSDLDLRLIVPPGWRGWLRVNLLLLRLRCRAFLAMIPLDLYAYDRPEALARFDQRERLLVLLDRRGRLRALFPERVTEWPA